MSFSQAFTSSPLSPTTLRKRRSRFTHKHLSTLAQSSPQCPLRVIAHIDLDAFYAQCEMVRLGVPAEQPLAVQQWQGLIAINYPARAFGLSRHVTISEARAKCPHLICQHVATWREGDARWGYAEDAWKEIATRKVSLDPYRLESRRILALIRDALPAAAQRVEKASVDEVFLDLSAQVHGLLLERYPELRGPPPYDDPSETLPRPPSTALDWAADALVDLDEEQSEEDDPDWDDVVMLLASEIVRDVRKRIHDELKYTCSAGISRNKMLAKLGSGHKKPNSQTVIRNRAVQQFLSGFKFTKIRNLGGKLGEEIMAAFDTDTVSGLLRVPMEQLKKQLGDDTGSWLHGVLRGEDHSEVNPRTQIKSMLSAKSFRPYINSMDVACKWLRIFVADIFGRLVEEGVLENKRRPKTINLHHRQGQQSRSKQAPIPLGKTIDEDILFELAKTLMAQVIVDGRAWPCSNLSLSVGGFEDGVTGNKGIGGFLLRGEEARALQTASLSREDSFTVCSENPRPTKKRRIRPGGIPNFFGAQQQQQLSTDHGTDIEKCDTETTTPPQDRSNQGRPGEHEARVESLLDRWMDNDDGNDNDEDGTNGAPPTFDQDDAAATADDDDDDDPTQPPPSFQPQSRTSDTPPGQASRHPPSSPSTANPTNPAGPEPSHPLHPHPEAEAIHICPRCGQHLASADRPEHEDFHFALDLQNRQSQSQSQQDGEGGEGESRTPLPAPRKPVGPASSTNASSSSSSLRSKPRPRGRPPVVLGAEKGQRKLDFG